MSSRIDLIMSKVRQNLEDSQAPETVPDLLCAEVMPVSPNYSYSFVDNSDCSENDLGNDSLLKVCRKKIVEVKPIHETTFNIERSSSPYAAKKTVEVEPLHESSSFLSDMELPTRITPVMTTEKRIPQRMSCNEPSTSHVTNYLSDNEGDDLPNDFDSDDSVNDKDYYCITEDLDTSSDTSIEENCVLKQRKSKLKLQNQTKCVKRAETEGNIQDFGDEIDEETNTQENRVETETITSGFVQAITEKDIVQETDNLMTNNEETQAISIIQRNTVNEVTKNTLTKRGTIRKRKIIEESTAEREEKKKDMIEKLSLKEPCKSTCKKLCTNK
ncbi:hypothetical protein HF086_016650 [Spodoptera exigua]|uniref:Uncharacterized protein n=1 Tax=Spodoptera exigua TaxID=7107 RepID=A0A922SM34_SPOEX|nr:hypothetical protein HF086_016650 [Spodoptera exigua]